MNRMADIVQDFYLDYVNNYLTVAKIAEHHGIPEATAKVMIDTGKKINEGEL